MQINLGCGGIKLPGFINIDSNSDFYPDLVIDDYKDLSYFKDSSVDFIYICHTLSNLSMEDSKESLKECYRILKPGGILDVIVPDFDKISRTYLSGFEDIGVAERWILSGGHRKQLFTESKLISLLEDVGYSRIQPFDLNGYPWLVVSDTRNPVPDPYHSAVRAYKV